MAQDPAVLLVLAAVSLWVITISVLARSKPGEPPWLRERVPLFTNTWQYLSDMQGFLSRSNQQLQNSKIVKFRVGGRKVCFVVGPHNVRALFRPSRSLSPDIFMLDVMEHVWAASPDELLKFRQDKSGRMAKPLPGTEDTPRHKRYWASQHHLFTEFFMRSDATDSLGQLYYSIFLEKIEQIPLDTWMNDTVMRFMMSDMSESAVVTIFGPRIVELNPGFMETMWAFMTTVAELPFGPPRWMNPQPWRNRDRFLVMTRKYLDAAWANFDWLGPDADANWEPHFGSRAARELARWMKQNLSLETAGGNVAAVVFGTNANATVMATWGMIEMIRDPALYKAVQDAVLENCLIIDQSTGVRSLDSRKMLRLPLLQSLVVEILRLHISVNVTREVVQPFSLGNYNLEKGDILQAPSQIAHYEEEIWGSAGHPAGQFWAQRHLSHADTSDESDQVITQPELSIAGKAGSYFPYGGGVSICPGRHLAKQEIILTLGTLAARFEIEFVDWINLDGSKSSRQAENDRRFAGAVGVPPDRDLRYRWKRTW